MKHLFPFALIITIVVDCLIIDTFTITQNFMEVSLVDTPNWKWSSILGDPELMLGGERDVVIQALSASRDSFPTEAANVAVSSDQARGSSDTGVFGVWEFQWDGIDNSKDIGHLSSPINLRDFCTFGSAFIPLTVISMDNTEVIELTLYSQTKSSHVTKTAYHIQSGEAPQLVVFAISEFNNDMTRDITAVVLVINSTKTLVEGQDFRFSFLPVGCCLETNDCLDENLCTVETCEDMQCKSSPIVCTPSLNECRINSCHNGLCRETFQIDGTQCNTGNTCDIYECRFGECSFVQEFCDDNNNCTVDICQLPEGTCRHERTCAPHCTMMESSGVWKGVHLLNDLTTAFNGQMLISSDDPEAIIQVSKPIMTPYSALLSSTPSLPMVSQQMPQVVLMSHICKQIGFVKIIIVAVDLTSHLEGNCQMQFRCTAPTETRGCPPGKFVILGESDVSETSVILGKCFNCAAGKFSNHSDMKDCSLCHPGKYSQTAASTCTDCQPGRFNPTQGSPSCCDCPLGKYSSSTGNIRCTSCQKGKYGDEFGLSYCKQCDKGKYCPFSGSFDCWDCHNGSFANSTGTPTCLQCAKGTFSPYRGATECNPCDPGYYSQDRGAMRCFGCRPGTFTTTPGACDCTECRPGSYSEGSSSKCWLCPPGKFASSAGSPSCSNCPAGTYSSGLGSKRCTNCPPGKMSNIGKTACEKCVEGSFAQLPGAMECTVCPLGYFSNTTGASACVKCPVGMSGNYSVGTEISSEVAGVEARCVVCATGYHSPIRGIPECIACQPGTWSSNSNECAQCPPGKYSSSSGTLRCLRCSRGRYQPFMGGTACACCPPGRYSNTKGSSSCLACSPGKFSADACAEDCDICGENSHQNQWRALGCMNCNLFTQSQTGAKECETDVTLLIIIGISFIAVLLALLAAQFGFKKFRQKQQACESTYN